jgi:hypothetical protein
LFRCADADLPERALALFREGAPAAPHPSRAVTFMLHAEAPHPSLLLVWAARRERGLATAAQAASGAGEGGESPVRA